MPMYTSEFPGLILYFLPHRNDSQNINLHCRIICCTSPKHDTRQLILLRCNLFRWSGVDFTRLYCPCVSLLHSSFVSFVLTVFALAVISALELTSRNILCGSVRIVYAIIYTLFLVSEHDHQHH